MSTDENDTKYTQIHDICVNDLEHILRDALGEETLAVGHRQIITSTVHYLCKLEILLCNILYEIRSLKSLKPNTRWMTLKQLSQSDPSFSEQSLRYLMRDRAKNGFSVCVRKIGKKLLINMDEFDKWIDNQKI